MDWLLRLIFGFGISMGMGAWLTPKLLDWVRRQIKESAKVKDEEYDAFYGFPYMPHWIVGSSERLFFTILVALNVSGVATAMLAWIGLKMATDWHLIIKPDVKSWQRQLAFSALLGSMISLFFASIGGLVLSHWDGLKHIYLVSIFPNGGLYMDSQAFGEMSEALSYLSKDVVSPILIAVVAYVFVDRLGEWKSRRNDCKLGIAIPDSLLGEILTGLNCMNYTYGWLQHPTPALPGDLLPTETWSGMQQTIPDQVLLRIISTSKNVVARSFHPNTIRQVCKDYFTHMCVNYNDIIRSLPTSGTGQQALCARLLAYLGGGPNQGKYIAITQQVKEMLEQTRQLLDQNSKRWFPK